MGLCRSQFITPEIVGMMDDMLDTMYAAPGMSSLRRSEGYEADHCCGCVQGRKQA